MNKISTIFTFIVLLFLLYIGYIFLKESCSNDFTKIPKCISNILYKILISSW